MEPTENLTQTDIDVMEAYADALEYGTLHLYADINTRSGKPPMVYCVIVDAETGETQELLYRLIGNQR